MSLGDIKPVTIGEYLGFVKDSAADLLLLKSTRSQMSVGARKQSILRGMFKNKI